MHQVLSEILDFFVSVLWKQIVTWAWLYSVIQRKAKQQVLCTSGQDVITLSSWPGIWLSWLKQHVFFKLLISAWLTIIGYGYTEQTGTVQAPELLQDLERWNHLVQYMELRAGTLSSRHCTRPTAWLPWGWEVPTLHLLGLCISLAATGSAFLLIAVFTWCPDTHRVWCLSVFNAVI